MPNIEISDLPLATLPLDGPTSFFEVQTVEGGVDVSRKVSGDDLTFSGAGIPVQDDSVEIVAAPTALNFIGAGVSVADNADVADITINAAALFFTGKRLSLDSTGLDLRDFSATSPNNLNLRFVEDTGFVVTIAQFGFFASDDFILENLTGGGNLIFDTFNSATIVRHQGTDVLTTKTGGVIADLELEIDGALNHDGTLVGLYATTPAAQSAAYTRNATIVEDRTLLASASATTLNNNNVLAALIADLQSRGFIG